MLSLAIGNSEVPFSKIKEVLHLTDEEIEEFVIDRKLVSLNFVR